MNARAYKAGLLLSTVALLVAVSRFQKSINQERARPDLQLDRGVGLGSNAPPVLAFTTVALGGFRGLIANALWVRATDLQQDGKYFEMVQLADWITKMEPTLTQVWVHQAWNMAYNISVKFPDPLDRWRWVQRGIELLRDQGLRYNPREALMYRELAWFFQHKMGQNLDEAHKIYKYQWAKEMQALFGSGRPNFAELINPTTDEARHRVELLQNHYKMDPRIMKEADDLYGPLEWRLPDAHAIYWAHKGLKECKTKDLLTLRRVIYSSMHFAVLRGRLISLEPFRNGSDLSLIDKASAAYDKMIAEEKEHPDAMKPGHRNWLREVVYVLYANNRLDDANRYFKILREKYPEAVPPGKTLDEFAFERLTSSGLELTQDKTLRLLESLFRSYYESEIRHDDDRALQSEFFARKLWKLYHERIQGQTNRLDIAAGTYDEIKGQILTNEFLNPKGPWAPYISDLRERLGLPPAPEK